MYVPETHNGISGAAFDASLSPSMGVRGTKKNDEEMEGCGLPRAAPRRRVHGRVAEELSFELGDHGRRG